MNMKTAILGLSLFCMTVSSSLLSQQPRQRCVLDFEGKMNCIQEDVPVSLSPAVRLAGKVPCSRKDVKCWCEMAMKYTNDVRKKNGVKPMLKLGTKSQMDNAMKYAEKLGSMGFLQHQDLSKVTKEVGCQRWMGGENLAFNYETGDIAKMCVQQWVESKGHFENLVRDWFEEVVVGFHFESDGRVYCVQTFALQYSRGTFGSPTDKGCEPVGLSTSPTRPPTRAIPTRPAPTRPTSPKPKPSNVRTAPLSCRCIKFGTRCNRTARKAKSGCMGRKQRFRQSRSCKMNCCDFCEVYPAVGECRNKHVKRICRML